MALNRSILGLIALVTGIKEGERQRRAEEMDRRVQEQNMQAQGEQMATSQANRQRMLEQAPMEDAYKRAQIRGMEEERIAAAGKRGGDMLGQAFKAAGIPALSGMLGGKGSAKMPQEIIPPTPEEQKMADEAGYFLYRGKPYKKQSEEKEKPPRLRETWDEEKQAYTVIPEAPGMIYQKGPEKGAPGKTSAAKQEWLDLGGEAVVGPFKDWYAKEKGRQPKPPKEPKEEYQAIKMPDGVRSFLSDTYRKVVQKDAKKGQYLLNLVAQVSSDPTADNPNVQALRDVLASLQDIKTGVWGFRDPLVSSDQMQGAIDYLDSILNSEPTSPSVPTPSSTPLSDEEEAERIMGGY